jgi:hypothetical protein
VVLWVVYRVIPAAERRSGKLMFSIGGVAIDDWQLWALLAVLSVLGLASVGLGMHLIRSREAAA